MIPAFCLGEGYSGVTLLSVVRSLGRMRVPVFAFSHRNDSPARFSRYCQYIAAPNLESDPDRLEAALVDHASCQPNRPALFAISDEATLFVSERREILKKHFRINVPAASLVRSVIDKREQYRMVERLGVAIPRTYYEITSRTTRSREIEFPVVIKPAISGQWPFLRLKGVIAQNAGELEEHLAELEQAGAPVIVQSAIPGPETLLYTVLVYLNRQGEPMAWGSYRKLRQYPSDLGVAAVAESVKIPVLEERTLRLLRDMGYTGVCGVEYKEDPRDATFRLIEMNPRFEFSTSLVVRAGADVPAAMYADLTGATALPRRDYREGAAWMALNLEWKACRELYGRGEFSWKSWIASLRAICAEALFAWDDPAPALAGYLGTLRNVAFGGRDSPDAVPVRPEVHQTAEP